MRAAMTEFLREKRSTPGGNIRRTRMLFMASGVPNLQQIARLFECRFEAGHIP
jgi:hypothetical protein